MKYVTDSFDGSSHNNRHKRKWKEGCMADPNNQGQFGNRKDTQEQAQKGGQMSSGSFGSENGADPSKAGAKGGQKRGMKTKKHNSNNR